MAVQRGGKRVWRKREFDDIDVRLVPAAGDIQYHTDLPEVNIETVAALDISLSASLDEPCEPVRVDGREQSRRARTTPVQPFPDPMNQQYG